MSPVRNKKQPRGLKPRGRKGLSRERLARAAGFESDAQILSSFPESRHKPVNAFLNSLTDLMQQLELLHDEQLNAVASTYGQLIRFMTNGATDTRETSLSQPESPQADDAHTTRESRKQGLAVDTFRQMVFDSVSNALVMLPSILEDDDLTDKQKLSKLPVYVSSLEELYELLQLEPLGSPGEETTFNSKKHESRVDIGAGNLCVIKQIGLLRDGAVIRKAVVDQVE